MFNYRISNLTISAIENLVNNASPEDTLHLCVLDDTDVSRAKENVDVMVQVIRPFNKSYCNKVALVFINHEIEMVELSEVSDNADAHTIISNINKRSFAHSSVRHDTTILVTLRPELEMGMSFPHYYKLVTDRAIDLGKTDSELFDLTEGLIMFMNDYHLNREQIERFMKETEDDCLVWDAVNGTYTSELDRYIGKNIFQAPVPETVEDKSESVIKSSTVYRVRHTKTFGTDITQVSDIHFSSYGNAEGFLAHVRDSLISTLTDDYTKEVVESDNRRSGILIDNDGEFYITNGISQSDHLVITEVDVHNSYPIL